MVLARRSGLVACLVATLASQVAPVSSVRADDAAPYVPPDFMTSAPPLPISVDASAAWRLDLAEALQVAMHNNLNVTLERKQVEVAALGIAVADGTYEPTVTAQLNHTSADSPPATAQAGMPDQIFNTVSDGWTLGLAQRLSTGTQLSVSFTNSRTKSPEGTAVEPLNYFSSLTLSVTQPILHGFSRDLVIPRLPVLTARIASERERQQLVIAAADVIEKTEDAYWDVTQALYAYDLELRSQKRAEDQIALTRRQIEAGIYAPSELIGAESTLAQRQLRLVQAEDSIGQTWDVLRAVLNLPRDQWARPILPIEVPSFAPQATSSDDALAIAIKRRPELAQVDLDLESAVLATRKSENDRLPEIDLGVSAFAVGQDAKYSSTLRELGAADAPGWSLFMNVTWTPLRRATNAAAEISHINHSIAVSRREQLVQTIWLAVRDAVRTQHGAARQVIAAAHARELAEKSLEIEQRKFLSSASTNFVVAGRQEELASAQLSELGAVLAHKKATAALLRATGQLLEARNVSLVVRK